MRKRITIDRMNSMLKYPGFNICSNNDFNAIYYNGKSKKLLRDKKTWPFVVSVMVNVANVAR